MQYCTDNAGMIAMARGLNFGRKLLPLGYKAFCPWNGKIKIFHTKANKKRRRACSSPFHLMNGKLLLGIIHLFKLDIRDISFLALAI